MLSLLEEIVLLTVDETSGKIKVGREFGTAYALAGAVLFDLVLAGRIDTDTETITMVNTEPTGNSLLDGVVARMWKRPQLTTVQQWIEDIVQHRDDLENAALESLIERGILRHEKSKLLWIIDIERYPV